MSFDRVFLGADTGTAEDGICEASHEQTRLKEPMARRGNLVYVLAVSSKLGLRTCVCASQTGTTNARTNLST